MHSIAEVGTAVPAFLIKLWSMVEDPDSNDLISWSSPGTSFVIKDEIRFAKELLPMYYKHNNMASFIRQLNMYGFHKIVSPDAGNMKLETPDEIKFTHPYFMQGHPYLLEHIKRKIGVSKALSGQSEEKSPQVLNKVLTEVKQMKGRQDNMDSRLRAMKIENVALWRELSLMRQKHNKQQQIVNKLIQFLITVVQQNHSSFSFKRKYPRMLQHHNKLHKSELEDVGDGEENSEANSPLGPVIHELDPAEALLETVVEEAEAETPPDDPDLYLDQSEVEDENVTVDVEMPRSVEDYNSEDPSIETIIGLPDDSLLFPYLSKLNNRQPNYFPSKRAAQTSASFVLPNTKQKETMSSRPSFFKAAPQRPTSKPQKIKLMPSYKPQTLKRSNQVVEIDPGEIGLKVEGIDTGLSKQWDPKSAMKHKILKTPQTGNQRLQQKIPRQLKLVINSQPNSQNNQSVQQLTNHESQVQINQRAQKNKKLIQKNPKLIENRQFIKSTAKSSKGYQLATKQEPEPSSVAVITVPYDCGFSGSVPPQTVTSVQLVEGSADTSEPQPLIIEVPPSTSPAQPSHVAISPQDFLVSSPLVVTDCATMPQSNSVPTPTIVSPANNMQVACVDESHVTSPSLITRSACLLSEMDSHLESVQSDLESLKELLQCEGISLDANALLGYLNDDPMSFNMSDPGSADDPNRPKENSGNEVMTCSPSLMDLADLMGNDWSLPSPGAGDNVLAEDSLQEVNTPLFLPPSPSFVPSSSKKRKK